MAQPGNPQKPILDQIIDVTLEELARLDDFDPALIQKLRNLANAKNLSKAPLVTKALKVEPEETK